MAVVSNTPRPGYVWDATDNVWYPIGVGAHQHTNAADTPAVMPYSTYAAAGKNKIINGDFAINQRNFTSATADGSYGFDRWTLGASDGTTTYTPQTFTPGTAPVSGYEGINYARIVSSGQTLSSAYSWLRQKIEDVRTFAGQTVTVSFWAKAATGTPKIAVELAQQFGSGGSAQATNYAGQVTLSTSWARYSATVAVSSISGKTIGTNSALTLNLMASAGSDFNARSGSLGIQSNTFDFWGVQVEAGSTVTAFQTATGNPASELAACQRYYWRNTLPVNTAIGYALGRSTTQCDYILNHPVAMRTQPTAVDFSGTIVVTDPNVANITITSASFVHASYYTAFVKLNAASGLTQGKMYIIEPSANFYIGFSAEL